MSSSPIEEFGVEILAPPTVTPSETTVEGVDVEVGVRVDVVEAFPAQPATVEVPLYPPVGGGYDRVEVIPFSKIGALSPTTQPFAYPIVGGTFKIESIAAHCTTAPTGSPVVIDILKNGVSIFSVPGDRMTIQPGTNDGVAGNVSAVRFTDGDTLAVIIVSVGSTNPGATLVVPTRLARIG